jgi:cell division protein FtsW
LQAFINIGVVSNLIPNTGISLPFFSYGGTALILQLAEMGIVMNISRVRYRAEAPSKERVSERKAVSTKPAANGDLAAGTAS